MTLALDINTPRGQIALAQEREVIESYCLAHPRLRWVETEKAGSARVDGLFYLEHHAMRVLKAVVEVKCRQMTLEDLRGRYENRWLITAQKVADGTHAARLLCVPFTGFLYLVPDRLLLVQRLVNPDGTPATDIQYETTDTQASINGGFARRLNAFVDMTTAKEHRL